MNEPSHPVKEIDMCSLYEIDDGETRITYQPKGRALVMSASTCGAASAI
jgi:hypothetical protein